MNGIALALALFSLFPIPIQEPIIKSEGGTSILEGGVWVITSWEVLASI